MGETNKDDRRKYARVGFATRIEIIILADGKKIVLDAGSKDLSLKGVFVRTSDTFPIETSCTVNVYLSGRVDEVFLEIQGRVVRQTDTGVGIVFESMDVEAYSHLKKIVLYNSVEGEH